MDVPLHDRVIMRCIFKNNKLVYGIKNGKNHRLICLNGQCSPIWEAMFSMENMERNFVLLYGRKRTV